MGTKRSKPGGLAAALFTPVQQRVLGLLFGQDDRRFGSGEIIALADSGTGAAHRQLQRLAEAGLVNVTQIGNQKLYQANPDSPIFEELRNLIVKTVGLVGPLRNALAPLAKSILLAFVFGSVAKSREKAGSDIDLLIVSDELAYPDVFAAIQPAEKTLGRAIHPTMLTRSEWKRKRSARDSFARRIAEQPKLFVVGDESGLG